MTPRARLALAACAAVITGAAAWRAIARAERGVAAGPVESVLVARKAIPAGRPVEAGALERRGIPGAFVEPGAFRDARDLQGSRARVPLLRGEQLTRSKIESASSRLGLAWSIAPGQTALALRLPAERAAGGHVVPGDWVGVFSAPSRDAVWRPVVDRVRVAAVQDRVWDGSDAPASPAATLGANEPFLVTLLLTPEQVGRVMRAVESGRLSLALLSPIDGLSAGNR